VQNFAADLHSLCISKNFSGRKLQLKDQVASVLVFQRRRHSPLESYFSIAVGSTAGETSPMCGSTRASS
jgi:hypothetical protein